MKNVQRIFQTLGLGIAAWAMVSGPSGPQAFAEKPSFTFAQVCDTQLGMGGYEHDQQTFNQAVDRINALQADFVVICGDLVGKASPKSFADFNAIKAKFKMPCHCVPGNHDVGNTPTLESLENYRKVVGKDYYSFTHKGNLFLCVNTQLWKAPVAGETEKHDAWVRATLSAAADEKKPVFVIGHYPLFTTHPDEKENYYNLPPATRKKLLDLFESHGVVAVLSGHTHRIVVNDYKGIQLVSGQATSKTHGSPLGFRVWHISGAGTFAHESIPLGNDPSEPRKKEKE